MNAYDDYAAEIKDKLDSLDVRPVVPLVPARGNDGIGGRDRSKDKVRAWLGRETCKPVYPELFPRPCLSALSPNVSQVRVMGAKLDADVAGTQALDTKFATEEHERQFQAKPATILARGCNPSGLGSNRMQPPREEHARLSQAGVKPATPCLHATNRA